MKEMKNMTYWKYKNNIPGINNNSEGNTDLPDGRSGSSPFQKNGSSGFKSSPAKHDKSAGGHSKKYGKHTNADHPNYWKNNEILLDPWTEKGQVHPQQQKGYKSTLVPDSPPAHKYTYKKLPARFSKKSEKPK